jgi:murein tripeptide amidase MpaA
MKITSNFDSGNINVIDCQHHRNILLEIKKDTQSDYFQWFYFRMQDAKGYPCRLIIQNAGLAAYPTGWEKYQVRASYDRVTWFQVPTQFNGKELIFELMPKYNSVYFAYFAPFSYEQHLDMLHTAQLSDRCILTSVGQTAEGRDIDMLIVGEPAPEKMKCWIIARQHPGEPMAEWFAQGVIGKLLDSDDAVSEKLLSKAVFYIIPNANIDGSIHGNLRTNALGINLNREWANPSREKSPEVFYIKKAMLEIGVDFNLDVHGDETIPYVFISGIEGIPSYDSRMHYLNNLFVDAWKKINPDFQTENGYPKDEPGKANLNLCAKQIAEHFKCLSLTLEMPFKHNNNLPDAHYGWSAARSEKLGESLINVLLNFVETVKS